MKSRKLWRSPAGWALTALLLAASGPYAQTPPSPAAPAQERPTFRVSIDLVTTDVIVRDGNGQFVADLTRNDFEVFEDGVKQDITSLVLVHGGRLYNQELPPPPPPQEGIILPPARPPSDTAGRIFVIFIDDLHLSFKDTPRLKDLVRKVQQTLIHEGDMFAIVSTGPSSIAVNMTYDRKRLDEAFKKIVGHGLTPKDILEVPDGAEGPQEVRYRAHVAFSTAYDMLSQLEKVQNRRKAFIYISNGYDFDPFVESRYSRDNTFKQGPSFEGGEVADMNPFAMQAGGRVFADSDLVRELAELTRAANRANTSLYTLDPRGLVGYSDMDDPVNPNEFLNYVRKSQDSLRVLAEQTGGIAVVNQNDLNKALKRIDAETSDYYVLGYYSNNPDPTKRTRKLEVKVKRQDHTLWSRTSYSLKPPPGPVATTPR
jgi:VWFA-related protein